MVQERLKILLLQGDPDAAELIAALSHGAQFALEQARTPVQALEHLACTGPDAILVDLDLLGEECQDFIAAANAAAPAAPIILLVDPQHADRALGAVHMGAQDCLLKGQIDGAMLGRIVRRAAGRTVMGSALWAAQRFLEIANRHSDVHALISESVQAIAELTGCEAVGIRLLDADGNIPYMGYRGFSQRFYELESPLSIHSDKCMCINVVKGSTDASLPFYSAGGSFYMNGTTRFLATVSEEDKGQTRNMCNAVGYESVALIPIRHGSSILGLIHLADPAEGKVPLRVVQLLERWAGMALGVALRRIYAEEALGTQQEKLRLQATVLDRVSDAVIVTDQDFVIRNWNGAAERLYGWTAEEAIGRPMMDVVPSTLANDSLEGAMATLLAEGSWRGEATQKRKDGSDVSILSSVTLMRDEAGRPASVLAINRDISLRKRVETDLRATSARLTALIEGSPLGIITSRMDGIVLSWNPAAERIFGWTEEEVLGRRSPIVPADRREESSDLRERIERDESVTDVELRRLRKDGTLADISASFAPLRDDAGRLAGIIMMVADVTERKRLEAQLQQSQKMETVGRLAGGVAHDFNNLLTAIIGYASLVKQALPAHDAARADVDEVLKASARAADLTHRLLAFSRRQPIVPHVIDLNGLIGDMEKMLQRLIGEDIELLVSPTKVPAMVDVDPGQIEQVLANLVVNARDAMPCGGRLIVETALATLDERYVHEHLGASAGDFVRLSVRDSGSGIADAVKKHIFEPFFTTKERGQGTGLGLATVYGIVKQHQGYVWFESEVGRGTRFDVYLPRSERLASQPAPAAAPGAAPGGNETLLVVEDDAAVRALTVLILRRLGYRVLEAADGEQALGVAAAQRSGAIQLLVSDVVMPGMSGKVLADELRRRYPGLKVLFMSGYTFDTLARHDIAAADSALLQKPFRDVELARRVRDLLDGRHA